MTREEIEAMKDDEVRAVYTDSGKLWYWQKRKIF